MRQEPSLPHPTLTPEYLGRIGPWSAQSWREAYERYGHRRDWAALVRAGMQLHPDQLGMLVTHMERLTDLRAEIEVAAAELAAADLAYLRACPELATLEHWLNAMYDVPA